MLTTISNLDLQRVVGGDGEKPVVQASESILKRAGGYAMGGVKLVGKLAPPIKFGMAGYDGYKGYEKARNRGAGQGAAIKEGGLDVVNSLTFGASNWIMGRK